MTTITSLEGTLSREDRAKFNEVEAQNYETMKGLVSRSIPTCAGAVFGVFTEYDFPEEDCIITRTEVDGSGKYSIHLPPNDRMRVFGHKAYYIDPDSQAFNLTLEGLKEPEKGYVLREIASIEKAAKAGEGIKFRPDIARNLVNNVGRDVAGGDGALVSAFNSHMDGVKQALTSSKQELRKTPLLQGE